jgi:hypothetical protein
VGRFVFSSSCSNYGAAGDGLVDEDAELRPITAYAVSKVHVERDVSRLADDGFSPVFLRNATAYGVSPRLRCDIVLNDLVAWAYATGRVRLKSDGTPWRPLVHAEDIARACVAVLSAPRERVHAQAFNVGPDGRELPHPGHRRDRPGDRPRLTHRVRAGRRARSTQLPGGLREDPPGRAELRAALDRARRRARALRSVPAARAPGRTTSRGRGSGASIRSACCVRTAGSTRRFAGAPTPRRRPDGGSVG